MRRRIIPCLSLLLFLPVLVSSQDQNCGLEERWELEPNQSHTFQIDVSGYANDRLEDPLQGLCAVEIGFLHNTLKKLELTLVGPDGQRIQLIGPNVDGGPFFSIGANWQVTFLPSTDQADPPEGFEARWDNDQPTVNFGAGGSGSFFPYGDDLENIFDAGSVNGRWTVEVSSIGSAWGGGLVGIIYHFRLVFCDETGVPCCFAEAGSLSGEELTACAGDPELDIPPPEVRYLTAIQPDPSEYGYTYLIVENGIVLDRSADPDLRAYPAGNYEIYGLSYELDDEAAVDGLDYGVLSLADLRNDLEGAVPSFCGDLGEAPIPIRIVDADLDIAVSGPLTCTVGEVTLDAGATPAIDALDLEWTDAGGNVLGAAPAIQVSAPGAYTLTAALPGGGCQATETVEVLEAKELPAVDAGPGGTLTCTVTEIELDATAGSATGPDFTYAWTTADGSIVDGAATLTPRVDAPGTYRLEVTDLRNGCTAASEVTVAEAIAAPVADGGAAPTLTCAEPTVLLGGSGTSAGPGIAYQWTTSDGNIVGDAGAAQVQVDAPGAYTLLVTDTGNGCTAESTVVVDENTTAPVADGGAAPTLTCAEPTVLLGGSGTSAGPGIAYQWTTSDGNIVGDAGAAQVQVDAPGAYTLLVTDTGNGCTAESTVVVDENIAAPVADAGLPASLTCETSVLQIGSSGSAQGPAFTYQWQTSDGRFASRTDTLFPLVDAPGTYELTVRDSRNGCESRAAVRIDENRDLPAVDPGPPPTLTCTEPALPLQGDDSAVGPSFVYRWRTLDGNIVEGSNTLRPLVDRAGTYELLVVNSSTGCRDSAAVTVSADTTPPRVRLETPPSLNCERTEVTIEGSASDQGPDILFEWRVSEGGQLPPGEENSLTPLVRTAGRYELLLHNQRNGCRDSAAVVVRDTVSEVMADPGPAASLTCRAPAVTLDGSGSTGGVHIVYGWTTSDGQIASDPSLPAISVTAPGRYELTVLDTITRCRAVASVPVGDDRTAPAAEAGPEQLLTCNASEVILDGSASAPAAGLRYQWAGPCLVAGAEAPQARADCPGTYYLTVEDPTNGCTATDSVRVGRDDSFPVADAGDPATLTCLAPTVRLNGEGSSQNGNYAYQWAGPALAAGSDSLSPAVGAPGQYTLSVTDLDNGCTSLDSVEVSEDRTPPTADAGPDQEIDCVQSVVTLGGPASSTGPAFTYRWSSPNGVIAEPNDGPVLRTEFPGTYELVVTDTRNGCTAQDAAVVSLDRDTPLADAGADRELNCAVARVTLNGSDSSPAPGPEVVYEWSGDCLLGDPTAAVVEADCPGVYTLTVTNTRTGCSDTDIVRVTLDDQPPRAVVADSAFIDCTTGRARLDGRRSSGGTLAWLRNGRPTGQSDAIIEVATPGTYQLVVTNTNLGCTDTAAVAVQLDCQPVAAVAAAGPLTCADDLLRLDGNGSSTGPPYRYRWIADQPGCIVEGGDGLHPLVRCGGDYRLIVTNTAVQRSDTALVTVAIDTITPRAVVAPVGRLTCSEPTVTLDGSASSADAGLQYAWTNPAGDTIATTAIAATNRRGVHLFEVLNPRNGCRSVAFTSVEKDDGVPEIAFSGSVFPCLQDTFGITATVAPASGGYRFEWSSPGPEVLPGADPASIRVTSPGPYTLRVRNDTNGCVAEATVRVTEEVCAPCVEVAPPDTLTCTLNELQLQAQYCEECDGCTVSWSTTDGRIVAGANTLAPRVDAPGTYVLRVVDAIGFTTVLRTRVEEDRAAPPVDAGPDRSLTCTAATVLLGTPDTTGAYRYAWRRQDGAPITGSTGAPQLEVSRPGAYVLEMTDRRSGCRATDVVLVAESLDPPLAEAGPPRALTCEAPLATLDGSNSAAGDQLQYAWRAADGGPVASGDGTRNPIVDRSGLYYLSVTDGANGCTALDSVLVTRSDELPPLPILTDQLLRCDKPEVVLRGAAPNEVDYEYRWCALDAAGEALECREVLEWTATDAGRFRFEITDLRSGCRNSKIVTVRRNVDPPQVDAGTAPVLGCGPEGVTLQGSAGPAGMPLAYQWRAASGDAVPEGNTLRPVIFAPGRYYLTATNTDNGCTAVDSVEVAREATAPGLTISAPPLLSCSRRVATLAAQATTASGNVQWRWQTTEGRILGGATSPTPEIGAPGRYEVLVTDPANACTATGSVVVDADREAPLAAIDDSDGLALGCATTRVRLDGTPSQAVSDQPLLYSWRVVSGGALLGDPTEAVVDVETAGLYRLVVTEMRNGCRDTVEVQVQRGDDLPRVVIDPSASFITCTERTVLLDGSASAAGPELAYTWRDDDGTLLAQDVPTLSVDRAGEYILQIRDRRNGCENEARVAIGVDTVAPTVVIRMPDLLDCERSTVELDGSASSSGSDFNYAWSTATGNILSGVAGPIAVVDAPGAYLLSVVNRRNGCRDSAAVAVEQVAGAIEEVFFTVQSPSCDGSEAGRVRVDSIRGGVPPYVYALNDNLFITESSFGQLAAGDYVLRVQDSGGCEWSGGFAIIDPTTLTVNLGPDQLINLGDSVRLTAEIKGGQYDQLRWEPPGLVPLPGSPRQIVAPLQTTTYSVVVEAGGCRAVDHVTITVAKERPLFAPTAFSPNGDGINDRFYLQAGEAVARINRLQIFDRWGQLVFQTGDILPNDPAFGWDGSLDGQPLNPAVFVYYAEVEFIDGRVVTFQGDVALVR